MFHRCPFTLHRSKSPVKNIFLVLILLTLVVKISFAQPCHCNHIITNQQTSVSGGPDFQPGDTICIQSGNRDFLYLNNLHGDSLHYIVFINCGGPVIVQNNYYMYGIKIANSSYFRFTGSGVDSIKYGIKILGTAINSNGLSLDNKSTNFEVDHLEIANTGFAGIMAKTDPKCDLSTNRGVFTLYHPVFHDNYIHETGGEGFYIGHSFYTGYPTSCNGIPDTLYPHEIKGLRVYHNIVENAHLDGIQIGCATEDCEIYENTVTGYGVDGIGSQNPGIQIGGGTTGKCYNNLISGGTGIGIAIFGTGDNVIFNNVIINAGLNYFPGDPTKKVYGIFCDDRTTIPGRSFNLVNNTILYPKTDGIRFTSLLSSNNQIRNNIILHPGSLGSYSDSARSYINFLEACSVASTNNYTAPTLAGAGFRDILTNNYRLMAGSPAIDSGADLSLMGVTFDRDDLSRPGYAQFDIGAFEYHSENIWTGIKSSLWGNIENWSKQDTPLPEDDIVIPAGTPFQPVVSINGMVCHNLTLAADAEITVYPSASITISGNLTIEQGAFMNNQGILIIKGNLDNHNH